MVQVWKAARMRRSVRACATIAPRRRDQPFGDAQDGFPSLSNADDFGAQEEVARGAEAFSEIAQFVGASGEDPVDRIPGPVSAESSRARMAATREAGEKREPAPGFVEPVS